jgi:hypothetical protein
MRILEASVLVAILAATILGAAVLVTSGMEKGSGNIYVFKAQPSFHFLWQI